MVEFPHTIAGSIIDAVNAKRLADSEAQSIAQLFKLDTVWKCAGGVKRYNTAGTTNSAVNDNAQTACETTRNANEPRNSTIITVAIAAAAQSNRAARPPMAMKTSAVSRAAAI